jgi:hypothetical protein
MRGALAQGRCLYRPDRRGADIGTPQDVTLQELRVEMFMPADAASEATLAPLAA